MSRKLLTWFGMRGCLLNYTNISSLLTYDVSYTTGTAAPPLLFSGTLGSLADFVVSWGCIRVPSSPLFSTQLLSTIYFISYYPCALMFPLMGFTVVHQCTLTTCSSFVIQQQVYNLCLTLCLTMLHPGDTKLMPLNCQF